MPQTVALSIARYRPEVESEPTFCDYEVPFRKDWAVLDALNYIKDKLDGSLSFRWSCRMGVCGSCGMMVNGYPKLTCATFLADYLPGPIRVEPLRFFPIVRDLVVDISDFAHRTSRSPKASTCRRPRSWTNTGSSACASIARSATLPAQCTA
jgi:fumarate reductase iron-sulfur subunit